MKLSDAELEKMVPLNESGERTGLLQALHVVSPVHCDRGTDGIMQETWSWCLSIVTTTTL